MELPVSKTSTISPLLNSVLTIMLSAVHKLEVFYSIVEFVAVYVMYMLRSTELSAEMFLHDKPMLKLDYGVTDRYRYIAAVMLESSALPVWVLRATHLYAQVFYVALSTAINLLTNIKVKCNATIGAYSASIYNFMLGYKSFIESEVRCSMSVMSATLMRAEVFPTTPVWRITPVTLSVINNWHIRIISHV